MSAAVLGAALAISAGQALVAPTPAAAAASFTDDFDGPAGAAADGSKWHHEVGNGGDGWGNHELEYYTDGTGNAALDGQGHLVITAKRESVGSCWNGPCQYSSAKFSTPQTFSQAYGHFEARMQLPRGQGVWPAFWMLGNDIGSVGWPNSGEIDIMENIGKEPGSVHGTIHGPGYSGANGIGAGYTLPGGQAFADGFHTFAVDWAPNSITWSVDGNAYETRTPADLGGNRWVYDHPFYIIMNLAVGGYWPGDPDGSTSFPQRMVVDYVHVTTGATAPPGGGHQITGLAGKCMDVYAANPANGTPVQLYDCNGTTAQQWTPTGGTLRALGKCLDAAGAGTADGTVLQLQDCNGNGAQQFTLNSAHDIVNSASGKCVDVTGNNSANGTRLQLWTCTGAANQKWSSS